MKAKWSSEGFTLLEIIFSLAIMVVIILGVSASYISSVTARTQSRELAIVMNATRSLVEYINAEKNIIGLDGVFNKYRSNQQFNNFNIDKNFRITTLTPEPDDILFKPIDGQNAIGIIEFPENSSSGDFLLTEEGNPDDPSFQRDLGFPRTLDGGFPNGEAPNGEDEDPGFEDDVNPVDLELLPMRILVRWRSKIGDRQFKLPTVLIKKP